MPTPIKPYDGNRGEVILAQDPDRVLWQIGGIKDQPTRFWMLTDYNGRAIVGQDENRRITSTGYFNRSRDAWIAWKQSELASSSQVSYATHLLEQAVRMGLLDAAKVPSKDDLQAMTSKNISPLIDGLKDKRGVPTWYGNGSFGGFKSAQRVAARYLTASHWQKAPGKQNPRAGQFFDEWIIKFDHPRLADYTWTSQGSLKPGIKMWSGMKPMVFSSQAEAEQVIRENVLDHILNYKSDFEPFITGWADSSVKHSAIQWDSKTLMATVAGVTRDVRQYLPGVRWEYTSKGLPQYAYGSPESSGYLRFQVPRTGVFLNFFSSPEIPFQASWSDQHKKYIVTSFKEAIDFRNKESVWAFLANSAKVAAFIRKGIRGIDDGEAAFYMGKLTPDGVVTRVLDVKATFDTVDEWHSTELTITLMLRTAKPVPPKLIETWLEKHWSEVQAMASSKIPLPAGRPSRYASWDDDEDEDEDEDEGNTDWMQDYPAEGLGWVVPNRMTFNQIEDFSVSQSGKRATVHVTTTIR